MDGGGVRRRRKCYLYLLLDEVLLVWCRVALVAVGSALRGWGWVPQSCGTNISLPKQWWGQNTDFWVPGQKNPTWHRRYKLSLLPVNLTQESQAGDLVSSGRDVSSWAAGTLPGCVSRQCHMFASGFSVSGEEKVHQTSRLKSQPNL